MMSSVWNLSFSLVLLYLIFFIPYRHFLNQRFGSFIMILFLWIKYPYFQIRYSTYIVSLWMFCPGGGGFLLFILTALLSFSLSLLLNFLSLNLWKLLPILLVRLLIVSSSSVVVMRFGWFRLSVKILWRRLLSSYVWKEFTWTLKEVLSVKYW